MKEIYKLLIIGLVLCLALFSCEKEPESYNELLITLSNGIKLNQDDIVFYDSADCIFLLKDTISFKYYSNTNTGPEYVNYSISLDRDTIYKGIVFMAESNLLPSSPTYIASYEDNGSFNRNIIDVKYRNPMPNPGDFDPRNDHRIISFLKKNGILRNGITVTLDSVRLSPENDSSLITTITIVNHDNINYYLPDPKKMGSRQFNFSLGGLSLIGNGTSYHPYNRYAERNWYYHEMDDLSILEANSEVTFTYTTLYFEPFEKGMYKGNYRFGALREFTHFELPLEQNDGWVWAGDKFFRFNNLLVE